MKEIKAIVQTHLVGRVFDALQALRHFPGVTISPCEGYGRGRGQGGKFLATDDNFVLAQHTKLEVFCTDEECDRVMHAIQRSAHTGHAGDGLIIVVELADVVRIRTGEKQNEVV